jgi:hypothetical protein
MNMLDTADWNPAGALTSTGASDITNQYISFGLNAGLGAIVLFILVLTRAYSLLGQALAVVRSNKQTTNDQEFLLWGLGVMLLVHIVDWFGITYFDQMYMVWFMHLAVISTLSQAYLAQPAAAAVKTDREPEIKAPRTNVGLGQSNGSESFSS